jgi:ribonuclease-3 family protein
MNLNGQTLAYLGDSVLELFIREYFIKEGISDSRKLHEKVASFTSGKAQSEAYHKIKDQLDDVEIDVFKAGRNAKVTKKSRNQPLSVVHESSGFEALFGHLYLEKKEVRIKTLIQRILE